MWVLQRLVAAIILRERIELSGRAGKQQIGIGKMAESSGEETKIKVFADGNGGLYVRPEDVFKNPTIREKIRELNEIGPMAEPQEESPPQTES